MRSIISLVVLFLLQACQTTEIAFPSGPIHPITSPITISNQSVVGAEAVILSRVTVRQGGDSGYMESRVGFRLSANTNEELRILQGELTDVETKVKNLNVKAPHLNYEEIKGETFELRIFLKEDRIELKSKGEAIPVENEQAQSILKTLRKFIFKGRSISQGSHILDVDMSELMKLNLSTRQNDASGSVKFIAIGHTLYEGRLAIVCKGGGPITVDGTQFKYEGVMYLDVLTGLVLFADHKGTGINKNNMPIEFSTILKTKI